MDKNNFKNTCVFAACGVICVTLLGISTMSYANSMYTSDTAVGVPCVSGIGDLAPSVW